MSIEAIQQMVHELEYVLDCINKNKIPFDGDDFHEALRLGRQAIAEAEKQEPVAFITPLEEQQMFDDWCPYKGNPDPRTVWAAAIEAVNGLLCTHQQPKASANQEPFEIEWPEFHYQGMGCGLEDRDITNRYDAMRYGWDCAIERVQEVIPDVIYTHPQPKAEQEPKCNPHPKAPHGFNRNASHANDRYVCECEGWDAYEAGYEAGYKNGMEDA